MRETDIWLFRLVFVTASIPACLLLVGGVSKLTDMRGFMNVLSSYELLPLNLTAALAWVLAVLEVASGIAVLLGALMPWPLLVAAALFVVFAVAMTINLGRGRSDLSCGCFGSRSGHISWTAVSWNIGSVSCLLYAFLLWCKRRTVHQMGFSYFDQLLPSVIAVCALLAFYLLNSLVTLWRNFHKFESQ